MVMKANATSTPDNPEGNVLSVPMSPAAWRAVRRVRVIRGITLTVAAVVCSWGAFLLQDVRGTVLFNNFGLNHIYSILSFLHVQFI